MSLCLNVTTHKYDNVLALKFYRKIRILMLRNKTYILQKENPQHFTALKTVSFK